MNKFRGYEWLNPSIHLPALACVASHDSAPAGNEVLTACQEWLMVQGMSEENPLLSEITEIVSHYVDIAGLAEYLIGIRQKPPQGISEKLEAGLADKTTAPLWVDALIPAALTVLHENAEALQNAAAAPFMSALIKRGVLDDLSDGNVQPTDKGRQMQKLGGYAQLILSYYPVFQNLPGLVSGELEYGLGKDVNRSAELNARASNGIIELRVAPAIMGLFESNAFVKRTLIKQGGIAIDFGAGGGEMVQAFLKSPLVTNAYGLDVNPDAVDEARQLARDRGIPKENIRFLVGSIGDRGAFDSFKMGLLAGARPVCTINFILHDVGPKMAVDFLRHFKDVLTGSPLIITESFRVPLQAMQDHPDYQAASFKFMHDISGQNLFYKEEFEALLLDMGFQMIEEIPHSSMTWKRANKKLITIATYVLRTV